MRTMRDSRRLVSTNGCPPATNAEQGRLGRNPCYMAHLAAGPWLAFSIDMHVRCRLGDQAPPAADFLAEQILHYGR